MKNGKLDAVIVDEPLARLCVARSPGLRIMPKVLASADYAFVLNPQSEALCREINKVIAAMQRDGTLAELDAIWFGADEMRRVAAALPATGPNGVLRLVMDPSLEPFCYVKDGKPAGYDIDMVGRIARKLGRGVEIMTVNFPALLPAVISGKADIGVGGIAMTPERARNVLFSQPNYHGGVVVLTRDEASGDGRVVGGVASWKQRFRNSFVSTFLVEGRYWLVLRGLGVTVLVSVVSILLGTVLGVGVCLLRRSRHALAAMPAKVYIRCVQGTPILVLLMILYYVVFGQVDVNAIAIAVLAFAINFAAYAAEMFRSGVDAVDRGQIEAAEALGFHRLQVFSRIVLPQAARHVLPVFKGEVITTVKMTSVIGYIAIQDLTKVSDIIRSRTYEAFFPLLATALIYFVFAYVLASLLTMLERRVDPRYRPRVLKKVEVKG
jgi:polar amino acid transport system substrate-binding protein